MAMEARQRPRVGIARIVVAPGREKTGKGDITDYRLFSVVDLMECP